MEYFLRRNRILKTLITLSLAFSTYLVIQTLTFVEDNVEDHQVAKTGVVNFWADGKSRSKIKDTLGNNSLLIKKLDHVFVSNRPTTVERTKVWDVDVIDCKENVSVKDKDWFQRLDPRFHEFVLRRHCRYFPMLINHPEKCRGEEVNLLIVVKSVIEQHDRRGAVRKTWGREQEINGMKIKTLFLLGSPSTGKDARNLQKLIQFEDRIYGDILQWDFMDTFFNLTLKEVNFLKWFNIYCPQVKFIFKGDDDVFLNTNNLVELIGFKTEKNVHNLFVGDTIFKAIPIRYRRSKYYIPRVLFSKPYPPYVGGGGFLMSADLARRLFLVSEHFELYPIDDVFLGMCLQRLGVSPENHEGFRTFGITKNQVSPMNRDPCFFRSLIVIHKLGPQELLRMWNIVYNKTLICAKRVVL